MIPYHPKYDLHDQGVSLDLQTGTVCRIWV